MNARVTLSSKGQIVIPKDVRDALELQPGEKLSLSHSGRRIVLEASRPDRKRIDYAEFRRRVPRHTGPVVPIEELTVDFEALWGSRTEQR